MPTDIEKVHTMRKKTEERVKRRKMAYVYLMHRMFGGSPEKMMEILAPKDYTKKNLQEWNEELKEQVLGIIQDENACGGGETATDVPTIKSIKEKVLRRTNSLISTSDDPAKLASVYKILSEYESTDSRKEKSVVDSVKENVKPLAKKDEEKPVTIMDVLRADGKAPVVPEKRGPGRPRKWVKMDAQQYEEQEVESHFVSQDVNETETEE